MENQTHYNESLKQHILAAGIISAVGAIAAGALKLDQHLGSRGIFEDPEADPEMVFHHKPDNDKTVVLIGGLCMNTSELAKNCKSQLADGISLVSPMQPDTGFNPLTIHEKTWQKVEETNPNEIFMLSLSMGGPLGWDWLAYGLETGRQDLVDKVSGWGITGSPMDKNAIRPGPRTLVNMVNKLGYSYALNRSRPLLRRWNLDSIADAPSTKIVPQCMYLAGEHAGKLPIAPKRIVMFRGLLPDSVVIEERTTKLMEQKLGLTVEQMVNPEWKKRDHARTGKASLRFMMAPFGLAKPIQEPAVTQDTETPISMNFGLEAA